MPKRKSTGESRQQRRQRLSGDRVDRAVVAAGRAAGTAAGAIERGARDVGRALLGTKTQRKRGKGALVKAARVTKRTARRAAQLADQAAARAARAAKRPLRAAASRRK